MTFFARPNLDDVQFKQLSGSTLTLSGETKIAEPKGLKLTDGSGGFVPLIATGGTEFDVFTYRSGCMVLQPMSGGTGSGVYSGASPTTCSVGGLSAGTSIYGCSISKILEEILVPTVYPTIVNPYLQSMSISPSSTLYEVGCNVTVSVCDTFNAGCIDPLYDSGGTCHGCVSRSCGAMYYEYHKNGSVDGCNISSLPSDSYSISFSPITQGNNTVSSCVYYSGGTQPYDSGGNCYCTPLSSGHTNVCNITISGIYPWYWGVEASSGASAGANRPSSSCIVSVITGGTSGCHKCVGCANSTLYVNFNSTSDDYIWFAVPAACATKTCWYIDALNKGTIGGSVSPAGNLFPDPVTESSVCSYEGCWSGQSYKIYISNYQTAVSSTMELRN